MATPQMRLLPRRVGLPHYACAAIFGWATSYYTFQPLLEEQARRSQHSLIRVRRPASWHNLSSAACQPAIATRP